MPRFLTTLAFALAASLALSACLSAPRPTVQHLTPPPVEVAPAPLPLKLGVHLPAEFNGAWWAENPLGPMVPVGQDSRATFMAVVTRLVGPVPEIQAAPPFSESAPAVDLVLVPSLADFSAFARWQEPDARHAVTWRLALFERDGDLISTWTVRGAAPPPLPPPPAAPATADPSAVAEPVDPPDGLAHAGQNLAEAARQLAARHRADAHLDDYLARRAAGGPAPLPGLEVTATLEDHPLDYPGTAPTCLANGLVLVRVRLVNRDGAPVQLDGLFSQLRLADGRVLHRAGPNLLLSRLALSASRYRLQQIRVMGGLVGGLAANVGFQQERVALPQARALIEGLGLEPGVLAPGAALEGLIGFLPQVGPPPSGAASLELWAVDAERRPYRVALPLVLPPPPPPKPEAPPPET